MDFMTKFNSFAVFGLDFEKMCPTYIILLILFMLLF